MDELSQTQTKISGIQTIKIEQGTNVPPPPEQQIGSETQQKQREVKKENLVNLDQQENKAITDQVQDSFPVLIATEVRQGPPPEVKQSVPAKKVCGQKEKSAQKTEQTKPVVYKPPVIKVKSSKPLMSPDAFKYGIPKQEDLDKMFQNSLGFADEKEYKDFKNQQSELTELLKNAFFYSRDLKNAGPNGFTNLVNSHREFINECVNLAGTYAVSLDERHQKLAGDLGFIAMKAQTYSGKIANLEADYKLEKSMDEKLEGKDAQELMEKNKLGELYEGEHKSPIYKKTLTDNSGKPIPVLGEAFRKALKTNLNKLPEDPDILALLAVMDSYDLFIQNTQIPPAPGIVTEAYRKKLDVITKRILSYNDRITARAIEYLDKNATQDGDFAEICKSLRDVVLAREKEKDGFARVAELAYHLGTNKFKNTEFNRKYTGVMLSEALANTEIETEKIEKDDFKKTGGAVSTVYIPQKGGKFVYRAGQNFRKHENVYDSINKNRKKKVNRDDDLDVVKGGIVEFQYDKNTKMVDAHKASRDVAASKVDELFGAGVIAVTTHVKFDVSETGGKKSYDEVSSKMDMAQGSVMNDIVYKKSKNFLQPNVSFGNVPDTMDTDSVVDLSKKESLEKVYWLQVVDAICGAADRHTGNFFLQTDKEGKITKMTGIDNDMAFGEKYTPMQTKNDYDCVLNAFVKFTPVFEDAFPCVPQHIAKKVMDMKPQDLAKSLRGLIRDTELAVTVERLKALQLHFAKIPQYNINTKKGLDDCVKDTKDKVEQINQYVHTYRQGYYGNYFAMMVYKW
jgi:predicted nucleic acid-binding protein